MAVIPGNGQGFDGAAETTVVKGARTSTSGWPGPTSSPITARTGTRLPPILR